MDMMNMSTQVGPFMGIARDETRELADGRTYRIVVYGAYNAMGLIGPESNGIAVLDEQRTSVLCDEIERQDTGYFGPGERQLQMFEALMGRSNPIMPAMNDAQFVAYINGHRRARYQIAKVVADD